MVQLPGLWAPGVEVVGSRLTQPLGGGVGSHPTSPARLEPGRYTAVYIVISIHCSIHSAQYTVYTVLSIKYTMQLTQLSVYSIHSDQYTI